MKRWAMLAITAVSLAACQDASGPVTQNIELRGPSASASSKIPGSYIVTLSDDVQDVAGVAKALGIKHNGSLKHIYKSALKGFAIDDLADAELAALEDDPRVEMIEADQIMTAITTQSGATWGLDRVDQRPLPLDGSYSYTTDGTGVTVYIIDTGINFSHVDFGGRATTGIDAVTSGGTAADCNGHGTHVAGTVGGTTYGLAKNVNLVAVRVLNCSGSGTTAGVVAGIDWVTANADLPASANMSLGGGYSATLNSAVARSVAAGITYA
ncbi:MAG TPA: S8 family serine peptidase, partial [Gammaproteobacteria bacterium]|nr:S8 family serine peptidase [Gammaproteobacteria bacterium]